MGTGVCASSTTSARALGKSVAQTQHGHFVLVLKSSSLEVLTSVGSSNVGHATRPRHYQELVLSFQSSEVLSVIGSTNGLRASLVLLFPPKVPTTVGSTNICAHVVLSVVCRRLPDLLCIRSSDIHQKFRQVLLCNLEVLTVLFTIRKPYALEVSMKSIRSSDTALNF